MSDIRVAERRKCVICGEAATMQAGPSMPAWEVRGFIDGSRRQVEAPGPADFCLAHYQEVHISRTRHVGLCLRCQAWRPGGSPCPKCGSALILMSGVHRWSR